MEYKKIEELTTVVTGGTPSTSKREYWDDGTIPWLQSGCCQNCDVFSADKYITQAGYDNSSTRMMPPETVMIALTGATAGKVGYLKIEACGNQSITGILPCDSLNQKYLYYYLLSQRRKILSDCIGGAQPHISQGYVKNMIVPVPEKMSQNGIVEYLEKVSSIINMRQNQIDLLNDLVKARFVELFGTLDNPSQEFETATLKELCNKITDGKHGGCAQEEGTDRYFVGAREIFDDEVHYETAPQINIEEFEKDYKRCNVEIGDFLIVNTGATIGKSAIASDIRTEHTLLQKSVALLKVKRELLNPVFLKWCYRVNTKMYLVESASAQPNLLLSKINSTVIYVPDISLQKQFADFVEQVDKSKFVVQKSLEETQLLFDSLMQEYFG